MEDKYIELPKVSVGVITYNQKDLLRETIESILIQEYPNLEIVIADDGSKDGTHQMLKEYETSYPGLFKLLLSTKNQGITVNSNTAFSACTGEYIAWIGGDDLMLPGKLHKQVAFLLEHQECSMCVSAAEVFLSETGETLNIATSTYNDMSFYGPEIIIESSNCIVASSVMVRKSCCPPTGFDTRIPIASDFLFNVETALNGKVGVLKDVLTKYRLHNKSITSKTKLYNGDPFITLGIIEYKYPMLLSSVRRLRAHLHYLLGVSYLEEGINIKARKSLWNSLRTKYISWKVIIWLLLTFAPKMVNKLMFSRSIK